MFMILQAFLYLLMTVKSFICDAPGSLSLVVVRLLCACCTYLCNSLLCPKFFKKNLFKINALPFLDGLCLFLQVGFGHWETLQNQRVTSFLRVAWLQFPKFKQAGGQASWCLKDASEHAQKTAALKKRGSKKRKASWETCHYYYIIYLYLYLYSLTHLCRLLHQLTVSVIRLCNSLLALFISFLQCNRQ